MIHFLVNKLQIKFKIFLKILWILKSIIKYYKIIRLINKFIILFKDGNLRNENITLHLNLDKKRE